MDNYGELYAKIYDKIYSSKNYDQEAALIKHLVRTYKDDASSLIDIGSGTCSFIPFLVDFFSEILCIEPSTHMQKIGMRKLSSNKDKGTKISFYAMSATEIDGDKIASRDLDVATMLFNVIGYINDNDLNIFLNKIGLLLKSGGLFIFDFWSSMPDEKELKKGTHKVVQFDANSVAERKGLISVASVPKNIVSIKYNVYLRDSETNNLLDSISETHRIIVRDVGAYKNILAKNGFRILSLSSFPDGADYSDDTYSGIIVAQKK